MPRLPHRRPRARPRGRPRHPDVLTPAEWRVLEHLREGRSNAEIAEHVGVSVNTVRTQVSAMLAKLGLPDRHALAAWPGQPAEPTRRRLPLALPLFGWLRMHRDTLALLVRVSGIAAVSILAALALLAAIDAAHDGRDPPAQAAASPPPAPTTEATPAPTAGTTLPRAVLAGGTEEYDYRPQVAYLDERGDVWLVDADGGNPVLLLQGCGGLPHSKDETILIASLIWSADGDRIACTTRDGALRAAAADGAGRATLLPAGTWCENARWSPDAERIACMTGSPSPRLLILDPAGTVVARILRVGRFEWSASGRHLVYWNASPAAGGGGIADRDGDHIRDLDFLPLHLAWTRDGAAMAYANALGVGIRDFPSWQRHDLGLTWSSTYAPDNVSVAWALDDTVLLVGGGQDMYLLDPATGTPLPRPLPPDLRALAPDGRTALVLDADPSTVVVGIDVVDLETGAQTRIGDMRLEGPGDGPRFLFSGDSGRLCWMPSPANDPQDGVYCSSLDAPAPFPVPVPLTSAIAMVSMAWTPFSPDLTKIAYTVPGPDDPTAPQELWIADLDGSNAVHIGPAAGPHPFAWRPDGVWRPWHREQGIMLP